MGSKTIVLADGSYTIRRIVELSFSEIEGVEVLSFEKGLGLKEKLLEIRPAAVIADIRLPEVSGYEICRFINETPALAGIPVFLMKGGFEPIDNEKVHGLTFRDIITKPFDSNALVQSVSRAIEESTPPKPDHLPEEEGPSFPEDLPEIEAVNEPDEDISFSDIQQDVSAMPSPGPTFPFAPATPDRDEVQPSEEITQGTQPVPDQLAPLAVEEEFANPFAELSESGPKGEELPLDFAKPAEEPAPVLDIPPVPAEEPKEEPLLEVGFGQFDSLANEDTSEMGESPTIDASMVPDAEGEQFPDDFLAAPPPPVEAEPVRVENEFAPPPPQPSDFDSFEFGTSPAPEVESAPVVEEPRVEIAPPSFLETVEAAEAAEPVAAPAVEEEVIIPEPPPAPPAPPAPVAPEPGLRIPELSKEEVLAHLEKKFDFQIQEILWEILPPMAERILKGEIEKIKAELEKGNTP